MGQIARQVQEGRAGLHMPEPPTISRDSTRSQWVAAASPAAAVVALARPPATTCDF